MRSDLFEKAGSILCGLQKGAKIELVILHLFISENKRGTSTLKPKLQDIAVHNSTALTDDNLRDHTR